MFSAAKKHTIERIRKAPIRTNPFPHLFIEEIFPPDFYAEMQRHRMPDEDFRSLVSTGRVNKAYSAERLCYMPDQEPTAAASARFWQTLFAAYNDEDFLNVWLERFAPYLQKRIDDGFGFADNATNPRTEIFLMRDKRNYVLRPHTDVPSKAISVLFYLPPDARFEMLGTSLYKPKNTESVAFGVHLDREDFDLIATIPFRTNAALGFPNLPGSLHGVETLDGSEQVRDIMLYDVKFLPRVPAA